MCGNPDFPSRTYDAVMMNRHVETPERAVENLVAQGVSRSVAILIFLTSVRYAQTRIRFEEARAI